jgi:hypothetical protein
MAIEWHRWNIYGNLQFSIRHFFQNINSDGSEIKPFIVFPLCSPRFYRERTQKVSNGNGEFSWYPPPFEVSLYHQSVNSNARHSTWRVIRGNRFTASLSFNFWIMQRKAKPLLHPLQRSLIREAWSVKKILINNEWRFHGALCGRRAGEKLVVKRNFRSLIENHGNLISKKQSRR